MTEHGDVFVLHRAADPCGHGCLVHVHQVVNGGDAEIELGEDIIGKIQTSVLEDIHLAASEDAEAAQGFFQIPDRGDLRKQPFLIETVRPE